MHEVTPIEMAIRAAWSDPARDALREQIRQAAWTGHNMPITAHEATIDSDIGLIGDDPRTIIIKSKTRRLFPSGTVRVLDLGSLEGGLSFEMAREGWDVLGIEGRAENVAKSELIREYYGLRNLRFEVRDVKSLAPARDGQFEAILCCGLLYHLEDPFAFVRQLETLLAPGGLLFVDTHVAPPDAAFAAASHAPSLSPLIELEDGGNRYEGRWHVEPREGSLSDQLWSAVSNDRSFWPTHDALIRALYHAGFHAIEELFGMFEIDREFGLRTQFSRTYLACRREWD